MRWVCLDDARLHGIGENASEQTDGPRGSANSTSNDRFPAQPLGLDADTRLAGHDVLQDFVDVGLDEILHTPRADKRQDVTVYAASIGDHRRGLLRATAFSEYEFRGHPKGLSLMAASTMACWQCWSGRRGHAGRPWCHGTPRSS